MKPGGFYSSTLCLRAAELYDYAECRMLMDFPLAPRCFQVKRLVLSARHVHFLWFLLDAISPRKPRTFVMQYKRLTLVVSPFFVRGQRSIPVRLGLGACPRINVYGPLIPRLPYGVGV